MRMGILAAILSSLLWTGVAQAQNVEITGGPTVEHAGADSAVIAWSTNVNSSTLLKYGTDPNDLSRTKQVPWGGLTHRVTINDLQPGVTYYYQAIAGEAQGTGSETMSKVASFRTQSVASGPGSTMKHP